MKNRAEDYFRRTSAIALARLLAEVAGRSNPILREFAEAGAMIPAEFIPALLALLADLSALQSPNCNFAVGTRGRGGFLRHGSRRRYCYWQRSQNLQLKGKTGRRGRGCSLNLNPRNLWNRRDNGG
jgi:hypothetical protein